MTIVTIVIAVSGDTLCWAWRKIRLQIRTLGIITACSGTPANDDYVSFGINARMNLGMQLIPSLVPRSSAPVDP